VPLWTAPDAGAAAAPGRAPAVSRTGFDAAPHGAAARFRGAAGTTLRRRFARVHKPDGRSPAPIVGSAINP